MITEEISMTIRDKGPTALQTAVVQVQKEGNTTNQVKCRILLDSGSQRSYITKKIAKKLKLPVEEESSLTIFTFGASKPQEIISPVVKLQMQTRTGEIVAIHANCVELISRGGIPHLKLDYEQDTYLLADDGSLGDQVDILVGNDYYFSIVHERKFKLKENLYLVDSSFGWLLSGQIEFNSVNELSVITYVQSSTEVGLSQPDLPLDNGDIKKLWELDAIGITDSPKADRDEQAIKFFNDTTQYINKRYTVRWPWIEYPPDLPNNFGLAYGRLSSSLKRMDKHTLSAYEQTLKEQIDRGIIEILPESVKASSENVIHYLPHHGVQQKGKPIRIVYDASSKCNDNKSLNQCLYCGPLMLEDLTGLLLRFRSHLVGLSSDIEKAFLQVALHENDRDVTRFLWVKDTTKPVSKDNLVLFRFCRVPFGVISSPFLLNATIKYHLSKSDNQRVKEKVNDIYVDNLITGAPSTHEALDLYKDVKGAFQEISMNIRDWSSNSQEFTRAVSDSCEEKIVKVLGLDWNTKEDTLQLRFKNPSIILNTKRGVLKVIASVYDPCGYAIPFLIGAKLFLQELWKVKTKWDTPLSKEMTDKWSDICLELEGIKEISVDRCYMSKVKQNNYEIHCCTDASLRAYSAAVYLVNGSKKSFVIGKSRLVPIKDQDNLTIPRLELMGVLIGSRLITFTQKFLKQETSRQILWTDSQIVIEWCKTDKLLPPFVSKRVEEIKKNLKLEIRYVPSELNPADVGTRPNCSYEDKKRWLQGPQFIVQSQETWPCISNTENSYSFSMREGLTNGCNIQAKDMDSPDIDISDEDNIDIDNPDLDNFNPIEVDNTQGGDNQMITENIDREEQEETVKQDSKIIKIRKIQAEYFPQEAEGKVTNLSRNLGLFTDIDGILRCKGRMKNTDWSFDKRYPILIPRNTEFTNKIILKTHNDNKHVGVNHTLSIIRESYWIPQGKSCVQRILKKCPNCVKHSGGPYKLPPTPALPQERVTYSSPYTFVGVDYMGPLVINNGNDHCKRWICLYTCLAVRAIHLEVVHDLTAEEGLLALRRMISTRGVPDLITSDNATHFKLMSEILEDKFCIDKKIRWKFIPQLAPWFGGFYERMVGIVKDCMKRSLQKHLLNDNQLVTIVKEIEAVINTRPLTCVDSEIDHVLKPSDFLTVGKCITIDISQEHSTIHGTTTKNDLVNSWKRALVILDEFKEMFSNRYLPSLRERYWHGHREPRVTAKLMPKEGQVVQIKGDSKNRTGWKVGKIVSLVKGTDGLCRVAKIMVGNKEFTRSIAHLYPLEMEAVEEAFDNNTVEKTKDGYPQGPDDLHSKDDESIERITEETLTHDLSKEINNADEAHGSEKSTKGNLHLNTYPEGSDLVESESKDLEKPKSIETKEPEVKEQDGNERPRRAAAIRALERIQEWTENLMILLQPFVGSVATSAKRNAT